MATNIAGQPLGNVLARTNARPSHLAGCPEKMDDATARRVTGDEHGELDPDGAFTWRERRCATPGCPGWVRDRRSP